MEDIFLPYKEEILLVEFMKNATMMALTRILNNDICMTNRYPSIREESFGSHIVIVDPNIKSL